MAYVKASVLSSPSRELCMMIQFGAIRNCHSICQSCMLPY